MDEALAKQARSLDLNISAAARDGVADAVRVALERADREAYVNHPESIDEDWADAEAWGDE